MILVSDGDYLLLEAADYTGEPVMGEIQLTVTGSVGTGEVWLNVPAWDPLVPIPLAGGKLDKEGVYRLSSRYDQDVYISVRNAEGLALIIDVERVAIKTDYIVGDEFELPEVQPFKAMNIYDGMYALVSFVYPFYHDDTARMRTSVGVTQLYGMSEPADKPLVGMNSSILQLFMKTTVLRVGMGGLSTDEDPDAPDSSRTHPFTMDAGILHISTKRTVLRETAIDVANSPIVMEAGLAYLSFGYAGSVYRSENDTVDSLGMDAGISHISFNAG